VIASDELEDPFLRRIIALGRACLSAKLGDAYEEADTRANGHRRRHRRITLICVGPGTLALLLSIFQLAFRRNEPPSWVLLGIEILLVLVTLSAVVGGYFSRQRDRWLSLRYRAERFRSSSFQVLIEPGFWRRSEPAAADWHLAVQVEEGSIRSLQNAAEAAEHEEALTIPEPDVCASTVPDLTRRLANHYRERRLEPQIRYLERLIERPDGNWLDNPLLQPVVFILSVVAVAVHIAFEWTESTVEKTDPVHALSFQNTSTLFVFLSAAIPVAWTGFRTWRGANEHARNVSRSRAKAELLHAQADGLEKELAATHPDPFRIFTTLAISENLLRNELREWLRLMLDTEWYG
jgi:hypothetical protein